MLLRCNSHIHPETGEALSLILAPIVFMDAESSRIFYPCSPANVPRVDMRRYAQCDRYRGKKWILLLMRS
jgi:hypothetical protein